MKIKKSKLIYVVMTSFILSILALSGCLWGGDEILDSDNDGYDEDIDAFPDNPNEWSDRDNDGVGDNSDEFPNDSSEQYDNDNDGIGNNLDIYDNGNGGIKIQIFSYTHYPQVPKQFYPNANPYFVIRLKGYDLGSQTWINYGSKTSEVFYNQYGLINPFYTFGDVDDDMTDIIVEIEAWNYNASFGDSLIDINGSSINSYTIIEHYSQQEDGSKSNYHADGRLDNAVEMDGFIEYYIEVIPVV
jgi:hypothetical protein